MGVFIEQIAEGGGHVLRSGSEPERLEAGWEEIVLERERSDTFGFGIIFVLKDMLGMVSSRQMGLPDPGIRNLLVLSQDHDLSELSLGVLSAAPGDAA